MSNDVSFSAETLHIDAKQEVTKIIDRLRFLMKNKLKRRGMIVGLSGGIDSSVVCALGVEAFGPKRVFGLHMPERHSSDKTLSMSKMVSDHFQIESAHEDISGILESLRFYKRYNEAVKSVIPEYGEDWKSKMHEQCIEVAAPFSNLLKTKKLLSDTRKLLNGS